MSCFFRLRSGSIRLFVAYILLKAAIWSFFDAAFFFGFDEGAMRLSWAVVLAVLGVLTYGALYITWKASILKVGLVGLLVDSIQGVATIVVFAAFSMLYSGHVDLNYVGYLGPQTCVLAVCLILLYVVALRIARPIGRFIADFRFKHEQFWAAVLMVAVVFAATTRTQVFESSVVAYALMAAFAALLVVPHALVRGRAARRQRMLLARTKALVSAYDDSLRDQAEFLEQSRQALDELADRIDSAGAGAHGPDLAGQMEALLRSCDALRYGTYSDDPSLDVMLVSWEDRFRSVGVPVEYRISPLARGGVQAALAVQALFEWAFRSCAAPSSPKRNVSIPENLALRVFRSANQLLIELRLTAWNGPRLPRTWVSERMPSHALSVREFNDGGQRVVRAIIEEEEASWSS